MKPSCIRCGGPEADLRATLVRAKSCKGLRIADGFVCEPCVSAVRRDGAATGERLRISWRPGEPSTCKVELQLEGDAHHLDPYQRTAARATKLLQNTSTALNTAQQVKQGYDMVVNIVKQVEHELENLRQVDVWESGGQARRWSS
jgi:hypothetical protein